MDDYAWLVGALGSEEAADRLTPHLEWAEARRLLRRYGYLHDNALPPPLSERLRDPCFARDAEASLRDEDDAAGLALLTLLLSSVYFGET